jgi:uncharacterized protein YutE (UPF0331/DUF86 family)
VKAVVDRDIILAKATTVMRHVKRASLRVGDNLSSFLRDIDRQESVLFNLQLAVQNCVDIAAHIVSEEGLGVPGSTNEMFYLLEENGYLETELVEKMVKAVGFRNLIVHEYGKIDLEKAFNIAQDDIRDLLIFLKTIMESLGVATPEYMGETPGKDEP